MSSSERQQGVVTRTLISNSSPKPTNCHTCYVSQQGPAKRQPLFLVGFGGGCRKRQVRRDGWFIVCRCACWSSNRSVQRRNGSKIWSLTSPSTSSWVESIQNNGFCIRRNQQY